MRDDRPQILPTPPTPAAAADPRERAEPLNPTHQQPATQPLQTPASRPPAPPTGCVPHGSPSNRTSCHRAVQPHQHAHPHARPTSQEESATARRRAPPRSNGRRRPPQPDPRTPRTSSHPRPWTGSDAHQRRNDICDNLIVLTERHRHSVRVALPQDRRVDQIRQHKRANLASHRRPCPALPRPPPPHPAIEPLPTTRAAGPDTKAPSTTEAHRM